MHILITGGNGFIGSNTAQYLASKGHKIRILDVVKKELPNWEFIQADIREFEPLEEAMKGVDVVIHLAAEVSVVKTIQEPALAEAVNVLGSRNVLRAALEAGVKKVVLASSAAVYGIEPGTPTSEENELRPASPYAKSKADMEEHAARYAEEGLATVCLRFFNVYGPGQKPDSQYAAAVPAFFSRALRNEDITIYGDGKQTRDFVFVEDVARAIEAATNRGNGVYNIATGKEISILGLAEEIVKITESKSKIVHVAAREGDPRKSVAAVEKAKQELGFVAITDLSDGLQKTTSSFR